MRLHVINAVFSRNVKQYFSGVLGYLFLVAFVFLCALMAFGRQFFAENLATLDQLSTGFPMLLLFFIPAITMTVWAEEKRSGTDAILFTLPASDLEILLGKYLAVAAVYTTALLFSLTQVYALSMIGNPDYGVIFATYFGYWLAGLALLSIGMFASSLTSSATVAFVLGAIFCSIPALLLPSMQGFRIMDMFASTTDIESAPAWWTSLESFDLEPLGIPWNLQDFTLGLIPLSNTIYFGVIIVFMLYLNLIVISKRHWSRGQTVSKGGHFAVRVACLAIVLVCLTYVVGKASASLLARLDLTSEQLYSLDSATIKTLRTANEEKKRVTVQAFISSDVPRKYVNTKKQLSGLLRQYQLYGGNNLDVRYVDVAPNSSAERQARQLGIEPQPDRSEVGGKVVEQEVYMGAFVSSNAGDVAIPFVDNDSSLEYELTHAIATTSDKGRKITLGIVDTDTFFAGPEINGRRIPWSYNQTFEQLKTQFKIKHLGQDDLDGYVESEEPESKEEGKSESADEKSKPEKTKTPPDVLIVPDPSSLTDTATKALVKYMKAGNPTILLADPLPFFWTSRNPSAIGVINAPRQSRMSPQSPYAQVLSSAFLPKADSGTCRQITQALGIEWDNGSCAWNLDNPHPNFRGSWPEYMGPNWPDLYGRFEKCFVYARSHGGHDAFSKENSISGGLNKLLFFYPGAVRPAANATSKFEPLVTIEADSGLTPWSSLTETPVIDRSRLNPQTGQIIRDEERARSQITNEDLIVLDGKSFLDQDSQQHVLAAYITNENLNVVFVADLDFLSDLYYEQEQAISVQLGKKIKFDNLSLLQNAIDVLAGDKEFVALRNRRPKPRTLTQVEARAELFRAERAKQQELIESRIQSELKVAQEQLDKAAQEIGEDKTLSFFEKLQQTSQQASQAQRRFDIKKEKLDEELDVEIDRLEAQEQQQISKFEGWLSFISIGLAIMPALLLGSIVMLVRSINERRYVTPNRRVQS